MISILGHLLCCVEVFCCFINLFYSFLCVRFFRLFVDGQPAHVSNSINTFVNIECHTLVRKIAKRFIVNGMKPIQMKWQTKSKLCCLKMIYHGNDVAFNRFSYSLACRFSFMVAVVVTIKTKTFSY